MLAWLDFAAQQPDLAQLGKEHIFQFGVGLAFLATVRKDGAPRLHPLCPVLSRDHLYIFVPPTSPKKLDLLRDNRYALQAFPPPKEESEEFYLAGRVVLQSDPTIWQEVRQATPSQVHAGELLFELLVDRAMYTYYENWGTPEMHPVHRKWQAHPTAC